MRNPNVTVIYHNIHRTRTTKYKKIRFNLSRNLQKNSSWSNQTCSWIWK